MKSWSALSTAQQIAEILKVFEDPTYLASEYFLNLKLWDAQRKLIQSFFQGCYETLVLVAGMRASKSFLLTYFALLETFYFLNYDYRQKHGVVRDSPVFGLLAAGKEEQAEDTLFRPLIARIENSPYFSALPYEKKSDAIFFQNNFTLRLISSKASTETGRTSKCVMMDEVSRLEETLGPRSGEEFYHIIGKSVETFREDGHLFLVGTPRHPGDLLMRLYEKGQGRKSVLAVKYPTWELNPNLTREMLEKEFEFDYLTAMRDFAAEPYSGTAVFLRNPDILMYDERMNALQAVQNGVPIKSGSHTYVLSGDPAEKRDAFGICLGHKEGDSFVIDGMIRFLPKGTEIDPVHIKTFLSKLADAFPISYAVFDTWDYPEARRELMRKGVKVVQHFVKKEDYDVLKQKLYERKVRLPFYSVFDQEMKNLVDTGRKIEHPRGGSKDVADAVANCVWMLGELKSGFSTPLVQVV